MLAIQGGGFYLLSLSKFAPLLAVRQIARILNLTNSCKKKLDPRSGYGSDDPKKCLLRLTKKAHIEEKKSKIFE